MSFRNKLGTISPIIASLLLISSFQQQRRGGAAVAAWYITTPQHQQEWTGLSRVVAASFHHDNPPSSQPKQQWLDQWLLERAVYKQYVKTARRMKGKKYHIFVAREADGRVVGVAELGMASSRSKTEESKDKRRPTIGLVCVDTIFRKQGVGAALVERCEHVVSTIWNDTSVYAEVDVDNLSAQHFFASRGYRHKNETVLVNVRQGLQFEQRPHRVVGRSLEDMNL